MPLYEYECESCQKRFERIQKYSDPPVDTCPSCGERVRKLLSSPAIQFKGSGWYITDYARKGGGDTAKTSGDKASKSESTSEGKPDGKSETTPSTSPSASKTATGSDT
jgi:putative FmdB family regulatory protein